MIRLVALDLDGTLLGPDMRMSETDGAAVIAARDKGVHIVLNTSRWYGIAGRTARRLELTTPMICHSGAHVQEPDGGVELLHLKIPTEIAREIAALCDEGGYETYTTVNGVTYMRTALEAQIDPARLPKDMLLARQHVEYVTEPATGFVVFGRDAVDALMDAFGQRYAGALAFPIGTGAQPYVTITAAGCDKGTALRLVCEYLEVAPEDAMAVGDAEPDLDMFAVAAKGVAMGNAVEIVKEQADAVAPSNAEGGVAWAIETFVLDGR
ncbi:MAG: Cof-type HAD-IIB family hydrolase [Dehalococcoidia bacterium]